MYETEDMLPRQPPEPSAPPLSSEGFVKPEVPEVSIIFGKPTNSAPIANQQPPSYAAWKKQVLPSVTYPSGSKNANVNNTNGNVQTTQSTVFPMRAVSAPVAESHTKEHEPITSAEKTYRHSLESVSGPTSSLSNYTVNGEQRRSIDSAYQRNTAFSTEPALTICASIQTDFNAPSNNSKPEFEYLMKAIADLQEEQRQTRRLLEAFIKQHEQKDQQRMMVSNVFCCDMATQCDMIRENSPQIHFQLENGTVHQALPNVKIYSPVAQSTQYRNNTPFKSQPQQLASPSTNPCLPKACTEKSMVMNELALKYLPSEKLNELMQDAPSVAEISPLREIDNFTKAPTDISTASFHYLRKYRLLPHQRKQQKQQQCQSPPPLNGLNMPEFGQQHQQFLQKSPIVTDTSAESQHLDFEDIKRQPKFL